MSRPRSKAALCSLDKGFTIFALRAGGAVLMAAPCAEARVWRRAPRDARREGWPAASRSTSNAPERETDARPRGRAGFFIYSPLQTASVASHAGLRRLYDLRWFATFAAALSSGSLRSLLSCGPLNFFGSIFNSLGVAWCIFGSCIGFFPFMEFPNGFGLPLGDGQVVRHELFSTRAAVHRRFKRSRTSASLRLAMGTRYVTLRIEQPSAMAISGSVCLSR